MWRFCATKCPVHLGFLCVNTGTWWLPFQHFQDGDDLNLPEETRIILIRLHHKDDHSFAGILGDNYPLYVLWLASSNYQHRRRDCIWTSQRADPLYCSLNSEGDDYSTTSWFRLIHSENEYWKGQHQFTDNYFTYTPIINKSFVIRSGDYA